tara:strand:- start:147 stop:689 length:543 start_codon:yes stop_codon:yes gene_type:complete
MSQIKVNSIVPVGGLPSGSNGGIIQIKQTVKKDTFSQTINDGVASNDTGLNVSITPSVNSSKIRLTGSVVMAMNLDHDGVGIQLFKDGSVLTGAIADASGNRSRCTSMGFVDNYGGECLTLPFDFLDSPATTSSITYGIRLMFFSGVSSTTIYMNRATSSGDYIYRPLAISTITAMEIST